MSELLAFTAEHVARLTGLSGGQLRYWDKTGFFVPTLLHDQSQRTFGRIYSFRDVVGLRTIAILRKRHMIPLQELRRVGAWLHEREHDTPWSSLRLALAGREVVFFERSTGRAVVPRGKGQYIIEVDLEPIAAEMRGESAKLRERSSDQVGKVVRNRYVVHNAYVIAGTRIPTKAVWRFHQEGYSNEEIIREYPRLTLDDVRAAIEFETRRHTAA
jgi:uncharacterized protein (DUF433 family)